jgi:hypothetical protein
MSQATEAPAAGCDREGCGELATHFFVVVVPYHRLFKGSRPVELVLSLKVCEAHGSEDVGIASSLIPRDLIRSINSIGLRSGRPALDLARAAVTLAPLSDPRYQQLASMRERA